MSTWQSTALVTKEFPHWAKPGTLDVENGNGVIQLERENADGVWVPFQTFDEDGAYKIEVVNSPAFRIAPTSDARFRWTWGG
jgi:hypothetical protein